MPHRACTRLVLIGLLATAALAGRPAATAAQDAETAGVLTLRDCVRIALQSSASLRVREAETDIADQDVRAAWGTFLPNLSASGSWNKSERTDFDLESPFFVGAFDTLYDSAGDMILLPTAREAGTVTEDVTVRSTSKDWSLSANLNLFDGLANVNRLQAAQASREASLHSREYTRELVIQNVAVAY